MNTIREIQNLNKRELEAGVSPEASWHADYRDTAYIYIGGLPFDLSEGDVITIFSQFGEPAYLNLMRDKETGKSKGFAFLQYEDQRSTDLAVDNLGGATVMGRVLKVDHTRYKRKEGEQEEEREREMMKCLSGVQDKDKDRSEDERVERRPLLKEELELQRLIREHDEDDPMKEFLVKEKREEVAKALKKSHRSRGEGERKKHRHHHRHHHRLDDGDRHKPSRRSRTPDSIKKERRHHHRHHLLRRSRSP